MHATEYTLPRRPAAPQALGTPVTSLPGATRVDEVPTPAPPADADAPPARASDKSPPPPPPRARPKAARRRGGLLDGVAATAAFATRHAVVRPLLAAAPLAYHLLPEHVAAELVADVVACVAALASETCRFATRVVLWDMEKLSCTNPERSVISYTPMDLSVSSSSL